MSASDSRVTLDEEKQTILLDVSGRNDKNPSAKQLVLLSKWTMFASPSDLSFIIDGLIKRAESRAEYAKKMQAAEAAKEAEAPEIASN